MPNEEFAILRSPFGDAKKFDVVRVEYKKKKTIVRIAKKEFEIKFPDELLIRVPDVSVIHEELVKLAPLYAVIFSPSDKKFRVVNLPYGKAVVHDVPVFADKSRRDIRLVEKPKMIAGKTFEKCSINLFRYMASGRMYEVQNNQFTRITWDEHSKEFKGRKVSDEEAGARTDKH